MIPISDEYKTIRDTIAKKYQAEPDEPIESIFQRVYDYFLKPYPIETDNIFFDENGNLSWRLVPGGRVLYAAGRSVEQRITPFNCYVIASPEDSMEGIFDTAKELAIVYKSGGGCGIDISTLRPEGAKVHTGSAKVSTGAWSWAELYSAVTGLVGQSGRRGALLISLDITHPDIERFVKMKCDLNNAMENYFTLLNVDDEEADFVKYILSRLQVRYANISVKVTDEFMDAMISDDDFTLSFKNDVVKVRHSIRAKKLWDTIVRTAWESAEPGLIFIDNVERTSNSSGYAKIATSNPCGEQMLPAYSVCNLLSINLVAHVDLSTRRMDWKKLEQTVRFAVRLGDAIIDRAYYPIEKVKEQAQFERRVGIGFMGLADYFIIKRIKYGTLKSVREAERIAEFICNIAYDESVKLAQQLGPAPAVEQFKKDGSYEDYVEQALFIKKHFNKDFMMQVAEHGIRNVALLTVPPTGSISLLTGVNAAFEPIFYFEIERWSESFNKMMKFKQPIYEWVENTDGYDVNASYMVTAHDVDPYDKLAIHAAIQKHIDNAISNTYTIPAQWTTDDLSRFFIDAWKNGVKGITVFREGSRQAVIRSGKKKSKFLFLSDWKRPDTLDAKAYKFPYRDQNYYLIVAGVEGKPLEIFLGSKDIPHSDFIIALDVITSIFLKQIYALGDEELYHRVVDRIINEFASIKSADGMTWYKGHKVASPVGFWGLALKYFLRGITPEEEYEQRKRAVQEASNMYNGALPDGEVPDDAIINVCPMCGYKIITRGVEYAFDCNNPCPKCGYGGKCD